MGSKGTGWSEGLQLLCTAPLLLHEAFPFFEPQFHDLPVSVTGPDDLQGSSMI